MRSNGVKSFFTAFYSICFAIIFYMGMLRLEGISDAFKVFITYFKKDRVIPENISADQLKVELVLLIAPVALLVICSIVRAFVNRGKNFLWIPVCLLYSYLYEPFLWIEKLSENAQIPYFLIFTPITFILSLIVIRGDFSPSSGGGGGGGDPLNDMSGDESWDSAFDVSDM